ncbi:hypothetical protein AO070_09210 [Pseudomonas syringae pv. syringae PD2766]|uniref:hypothetical protein n=1 Tax=Pseudomonas syringae TaxID=317 RepID=UPI0007375A92|nr:hypothetical protein [Pseudomonas syringae]KTB83888.1 hypothetical protein AO070_09210 [Pseudomonas syringae pv. syringae PD2766]
MAEFGESAKKLQKHPVDGVAQRQKGMTLQDNRAVLDSGQRQALDTAGQARGGHSGGVLSTSGKVVQRKIILKEKDGLVQVSTDAKRPAGAGGHQGDHTTPFATLQAQIQNGLAGLSVDDGWASLSETFEVYKKLPGWLESSKWVTATLGNSVTQKLAAKGDAKMLQAAANELLRLRNGMEYTSIKKGGVGNAEGTWHGSLQYNERQYQLDKNPVLKKQKVLDYMWKAFDHGRVGKMKNAALQTGIYTQHAMTMADAYPQLNLATGIAWPDVLGHRSSQKNWASYDPELEASSKPKKKRKRDTDQD